MNMYRQLFTSLTGIVAFITGNLYLFGFTEIESEARLWGVFAIMGGVILASLAMAAQTWWVLRVSTAALVVLFVSQIPPLLFWVSGTSVTDGMGTVVTDSTMYISLHISVALLSVLSLLIKQTPTKR